MEVGSAAWNRLVSDGADLLLNTRVSPLQLEQFATHIRELTLWNQKTNLTAITDPAKAAVKHIVDSLAVARWIPAEATVLDVGSGGGFPGIPLKILKPSLSVTLIDASRKKNSFQRHIIRTLKLDGIIALQQRVEALAATPEYMSSFSVIICRAFTHLSHFIETAVPLLKPDGVMIAMKGSISDDEKTSADAAVIRLFQTGHMLQSRVVPYVLPFLNSERCLYIFSKY